MMVAKIMPVIFVFSVLAAIVSSPIWGRALRSYRDITEKARSLSSSIVTCKDAVCLLGGADTTLGSFVQKEKLGAKISLIYCVNARMNDCFNEWQAEVVRRLFPKILWATIVFLFGFATLGFFEADIRNVALLKDIDVYGLFYFSLGMVFSFTEVYTAIGMAGRYSEIAATGKKLLDVLK